MTVIYGTILAIVKGHMFLTSIRNCIVHFMHKKNDQHSFTIQYKNILMRSFTKHISTNKTLNSTLYNTIFSIILNNNLFDNQGQPPEANWSSDR